MAIGYQPPPCNNNTVGVIRAVETALSGSQVVLLLPLWPSWHLWVLGV